MFRVEIVEALIKDYDELTREEFIDELYKLSQLYKKRQQNSDSVKRMLHDQRDLVMEKLLEFYPQYAHIRIKGKPQFQTIFALLNGKYTMDENGDVWYRDLRMFPLRKEGEPSAFEHGYINKQGKLVK